MYMTKTWGFSVPCGPLQFRLSGFRDRARGLLQPGDLVAIVGTFGANTPEQERGMILGLMEPSTVVVSSLDYYFPRRGARGRSRRRRQLSLAVRP